MTKAVLSSDGKNCPNIPLNESCFRIDSVCLMFCDSCREANQARFPVLTALKKRQNQSRQCKTCKLHPAFTLGLPHTRKNTIRLKPLRSSTLRLNGEQSSRFRSIRDRHLLPVGLVPRTDLREGDAV